MRDASDDRRSHAMRSRVSGGWNPAVHLTCHLGGKPVWNEALAAFVPGHAAARHARRGRRERRADARRMPDGRRRGRRAGGGRMRFSDRHRSRCRAQTDEPAAIAPLWHVEGEPREGLRRFPERCDRRTTSRSPTAKASARSSISSATRRSAWRPIRARPSNVTGLAILAELSGRTIPQVGTTTFRPPYMPVALRRDGRPSSRQGFPPDAAHALASTGPRSRARCSSRPGAWLRAQYYPRAGEKDWLETVNREVTATRAQRRRLRCLDARQDRVRGRGRRGVPRSRLHQHVLDACRSARRATALMLREDGFVMDDGTTVAARARALLHDHDHRERRRA